MARYVNLDNLLAEIERLREVQPLDAFQPKEQNKIDWLAGKLFTITNLEVFLNTFEVKEVDLEKELQQHINDCLDIKFPITNIELIKKDVAYTAKKFFELGLKAKDWKKERMEECPYRQVGCTMYEGKILECKGACSWVVDYPKLKELKAQKGK